MTNKNWSMWIAAATLTVAGLGAGRYAVAQLDAPPTPPDANGGPPVPGGGGFGGRRAGGGFGFFGGGGAASMAVSGNNLYILRGNTVYRLNATTLAVEAHSDLPADATAMSIPGGGAGPGAGSGGRRFRPGGPPAPDNGGPQ